MLAIWCVCRVGGFGGVDSVCVFVWLVSWCVWCIGDLVHCSGGVSVLVCVCGIVSVWHRFGVLVCASIAVFFLRPGVFVCVAGCVSVCWCDDS